jgi:phage FluMu protein Com
MKKKIIFHCKKCNKDFKKRIEGYWNWKCPKCQTISPRKDFGISFRGLPTIKN